MKIDFSYIFKEYINNNGWINLTKVQTFHYSGHRRMVYDIFTLY